MKLSPVLFAVALSILPGLAAANSIEAAGVCLTDNTSGKDRKILVKWIFIAISRHPEIRAMSSADAAQIEQSNKEVGALYTRLIADDCPKEMKAMVAEHGASAISQPFEVLGRVAMQELMTDAAVNAHFGGIEKFADLERIGEVMKVD